MQPIHNQMMLCRHNSFGQGRMQSVGVQSVVDTFERRVIGHQGQLPQIVRAARSVDAPYGKSAGRKPQAAIYFTGLVPSAIENPASDLRTTFDAILNAGIEPGHVVFEIEEEDLARDPAHSEAIRRYLRLKGFAFAVANAGVSAGGFSLQAVRDSSPDYIKLDKRLVRNLHQLSCAPIIRKLVQLGEVSGACVVAEGVDRLGMLEDLWLLGVRFMQGRLFGQRELLPM
ncbi:MAG: EAL domain-containing protein [Acidobacteriota bacterium]|nr:EAL domain-containing protein [Acidobacteriota bacterium]